jgi:predicted TIM-barrel fold metal-dependent hydrolase
MRQEEKDHFIPYAWINIREDGYIKHLKEIQDQICGIKFHPSISQVVLIDEKMEELLTFCEGHELPMLVHCGRNPISHVKYVLETSGKYENIIFIAAHLGGNAFDLIEDAIERCKHHSMSNVFLDTSTGRHPDLLRKAIKAIGDERILFGTDLPYTNMELNMKYIELCDLTHKEFRNIMGYNFMKRILKRL